MSAYVCVWVWYVWIYQPKKAWKCIDRKSGAYDFSSSTGGDEKKSNSRANTAVIDFFSLLLSFHLDLCMIPCRFLLLLVVSGVCLCVFTCCCFFSGSFSMLSMVFDQSFCRAKVKVYFVFAQLTIKSEWEYGCETERQRERGRQTMRASGWFYCWLFLCSEIHSVFWFFFTLSVCI